MDICEVKSSVNDAYGVNANYIEKVKNVYKIHTEDNQYCLKLIKYNLGHFLFIIAAIKHLQNNKFKYIPKIIKTKNHKDYIELEGNFAYLTEWVPSRQCNYDNPVDILIATSKLAELHKKSQGFNVRESMNPRVGWLKWIKTFKTRGNEILDFRDRIYKKDKKTEFDLLYLSLMEEELNRVEKSIENLTKSNYIELVSKHMEKREFCHHDYANHNILIGANGEVNVIDFDYCILDTHLHDLASLMIRRMKHGKWSIDNALFILEAYNVVNTVVRGEIPIMAAFMEFPQDYWQVGIQYYWEKQPWQEEFFLRKLKNFYKDREEKQEFIDKFRYIKFN